MAKGTVEKRPLTEDELADAKRLKEAWIAFKAERDYATQDWLGKATKLGNQSLMGQYLNGSIQLNAKAVLAFANILGVHPSQISPRMDFPLAAGHGDTLSADTIIELLLLYRQSTAKARERILLYARSEEKDLGSLRTIEPTD